MTRRLFRVLAAALSVFFVVAPLVSTHAAVLTGRRDIMSRQNPSVASNHEIRFITSTGVDASSDTITIDFPSGFNLSTVLFGDVDLYHGAVTGFETNETIAASAAAGVWGFAKTGQTLTLTAPTDAVLGEIAVGDVVNVRIGTNAVGGTNRIINPSGGGSAVNISIGGTFGDVGGIEVFVGSNDTIAISATIAAAPPVPGPGGGGGGGGTDGTPPTIFNVQVINITASSSVVTWQTDEPATSRVDFGTTFVYGTNVQSGTLVSSHSMPLTGLPSDTNIHFRITSADAIGNVAQTGDAIFHTLPPPAAPLITNVRAISITDTSSIIAWDTNVPASSLVEYGLTTSYTDNASTGGNVSSHNVSLFGLQPSTLYHYRVTSVEPVAGLTTISGDFTFTTTGDVTAPANVFGFTATAGNARNTLNWSNPSDPDFSFVRIRARTDGYPSSPTDGRLVYQGSGSSFVDSGLVNGVTYFYVNYAFDNSGNHSSGAFAQATPSGPPVIPPPPVPPPPVAPPGSGPSTPPTTPPSSGGGSTTTPPIPPPVSATPTPPIVLPPTSTPPVESEGPVITISPSYFSGGGSILLVPDSSGAVGSPQGASVLVRVPVTDLPSQPTSAVIRVGTATYALTPLPGGTDWGATFVPSRGVERVPATVQFQLEDGKTVSASTIIETKGQGRILERRGISPELSPVQDASVRLFEFVNGQWQEWKGAQYGQSNPINTGAQGFYGFAVRNGRYRVVVEKEGYVAQEKELDVTGNYISVDVILPTAIEIPIIGPILEVLQSEQAREAATISAPVVVALALANVAVASSLFSLLNYLWFLLTQPVLLLNRKKREKWGLVYNSLSKHPIDLAVVRLVQAQTRIVVQTHVTDAKGRFAFRVKPGLYRIEVVKPGFVYPTALLKGEREDVDLLDLYHGENIEVKEESNIAVNIPVDPITKEETPFIILLKRFMRRAQHAFSLISVFITLFALMIAPSWLMVGLLVLQVLTYLLFRRLALPKKPKGWGIIYDAGTRKPVGTSIVRIFDKKFNKLLETQVTDSKGQYGFFASKSLYFITAEKPGFEKYKSEDLDLTKAKEAVIDKHIPLKKASNTLSTGATELKKK
ncbi:fibronectin type III domain-containing protein [Candidatus Uhrbacteria bacterium]|nr:fibronectin type III domain-containing protein [Candidatus Uhrbacteria bacterium]